MEIRPKYIVRNNKSGEEFKALVVSLYFMTHNWLEPEREFQIIYTDDTEHVKCVVNYDAIREMKEKKIVYDLNDSFDVFRINENGSLEKLSEIRALIPRRIDPDYHMLEGIFEWQCFEMYTIEGIQWAGQYDIAKKYAETLNPMMRYF